jgi:hypothetical protein
VNWRCVCWNGLKRRSHRIGGMSAVTSIRSLWITSGTRKEAVSRTYQGFDGYTPIAAYLGNEGWSIGLELRPGSQHSARETEYVYERVFPRIERVVPADQPVLLRETAVSIAPACCGPRPPNAIAFRRWDAHSTSSANGIRANRTRPPG